jgi:GNAT superfamily N-acetyltransferase
VTSQHASLQIVSAGDADIEPLLDLCAEHARFEKATFDRARRDTLLRDISDEQNPLQVHLAVSGGRPVGYVALSREISTWSGAYAHMDCLYVVDGMRGAGVGSALMDAARAAAIAAGHSRMEWQTPAWNRQAIGFYRKQGARDAPKARFTLALR